MLHTSHAFRLRANGNEACGGLNWTVVTKKERGNRIGNEGTLKTGTKCKFYFFIQILCVAFEYGLMKHTWTKKWVCLMFLKFFCLIHKTYVLVEGSIFRWTFQMIKCLLYWVPEITWRICVATLWCVLAAHPGLRWYRDTPRFLLLRFVIC